MLLENSFLLLLAVVLTLVSVAAAGLIGMEVFRLVRLVITGRRVEKRGRRGQVAATGGRKKGETGPLVSEPPTRKEAYEDRETVEKLIDHFEGE